MDSLNVLLFLAVTFLTVKVSLQGPDQRKLYNDLMAGYNPLVRPVSNDSQTLTVQFGLTLMQIMDVSPPPLIPPSPMLCRCGTQSTRQVQQPDPGARSLPSGHRTTVYDLPSLGHTAFGGVPLAVWSKDDVGSDILNVR
ncbi:hypothetical protein PFLUV_G00029530 [Perca fluviatilis]|uniref:Neurotransmitter-gated ion-channel ligand-binding domain-containing protein n=1 Tax=Perca fluviatilis TaxID=8168 RepID=A0A6A5FJU5_PERFL|nr:hypothetical protein PFLUV_G00029530 [Perca fluviatilis]